MKITGLEFFLIKPRWLFLKVSTDVGISGWGERIVEGFAGTTAAAVDEMRPHIIGKDPRRIEDLYQTLYRSEFYRGGPILMIAIGPIPYIGSNRQIDEAARKFRAVREAVGPDFDIALDFHGRVHRPLVKTLIRELEPMRSLFFEEPLVPENSDALAEVAAHTSVPLATGERLFGRAGFKQIIAQGAVGILQPDLSHAGGIWECRKIAAMAEAEDIVVASHCPLGPLALAASLQLDACTPNFAIQEMSIQIHYNQGADLLDYVVNKEMFAVKDGYVDIPDRPGLGVEIDEERVRKAAIEGHDYRTGSYRLEDGTIAEW